MCFSNIKEFEHVSLRTIESYGWISVKWPGDLFVSKGPALQDSLESEKSKESLSRIMRNPLAKPNLPFYLSLENAAEHFLNFRPPLDGIIYVILPDYRARIKSVSPIKSIRKLKILVENYEASYQSLVLKYHIIDKTGKRKSGDIDLRQINETLLKGELEHDSDISSVYLCLMQQNNGNGEVLQIKHLSITPESC